MNFRKLSLKSGKKVLAGKNAESNEELVNQVKDNEIVLHTRKPGSPFVNIKSESKKMSKKDLKEAAIFCAKFSQAWKKPKINPEFVEVDYFLGKNIVKIEGMKLGSFLVKKHKTIKVKREEIIKFLEK